jgi:TonB-linked SusC/RagA family outer membrane protein
MLRKLLTFTLLCFVGVSYGFAQSGSIEGTITDQSTGEPLPATNVYIPELERGTSTNPDGEYSIENVAAGTYTIRVTYIGYTTVNQQVQVDNDATVQNFELVRTNQNLEELVVTGYSTTTAEKSSVSSQSVGKDDIVNRPDVSVTQRLSGQVAGLNITSSNGQPGANSTINLRGVGSLNGNTEPLFIMDGTPIDEDNFRSLNPDEISNITVLKDAGATAIYGNRGANGVVIIETDKGSYGSGFQVSYGGQLKTTSLPERNYNLFSGPDQIQYMRSLDLEPLPGVVLGDVPDTDWVDHFFDPSISQSHTLTLNNGRENTKSLTSFGFTSQDGALQDSELRRFNLRNNISGRSENRKFDYNINTSINYSQNDDLTSIGTGGVNQNPILAAYQGVPYLAPSDYTSGLDLVLGFRGFVDTPLFLIDKLANNTNSEDETKLVGSANGSYEIIDGLSLNATVGGDYSREDRIRTQGPNSFNSILFAQSGNTTPGSSTSTNVEVLRYNVSTNVRYETQFSDVHTVTSGAYFEINQGFYQFDQFTNQGLDARTFSPGDGAGFIPDNSANDFFSNDVAADRLQSGLLSYFGTLGYDYDTRYGIDLSLRRDASYRFSDTNRWGTFYSVSGRWNISNEEFMEDSPIDVLKLRGSYGKTGNQRIVSVAGQFAPFAGARLTESTFTTGSGYLGQNASFLNQIGNSELKWENVFQTNLGLDIEVFNSRLRGSFDAYVKTTEDLFQDRPVSAINATTNQRANIGSLENRGIDVDLSYDVLRARNGLNLTVGVVGNYNKQELLDIPTPTGRVEIGGIRVNREGGPIREYFVYPYVGVNEENGNLLFLDIDGNETENPTAEDRRFTGENVFPDYSGSMTFDAGFKGFTLSTQWQFTLGVKRFDFNRAGYVSTGNIGAFQVSKDLLDTWTEENTDAALPSLSADNFGDDAQSDRFLRDSDYLRLRFASLGYTLPASLIESVGLRGANVFVSGQNLLTFTPWDGADPETLNGVNSRLYPNARILTAGIDIQL